MGETALAKESIADRALREFLKGHTIASADRLRRAGLDSAAVEDLVRIYHKIENADMTQKIPADRRPTLVDPQELTSPRPGCV